ncbi:hypothetical protein PS467_14790 [Streptomyces luomodiensis]|uniref:Lipoprotein n=1 Tax=Streptomyces luomodiensis TaxID=3026192 RepID=A0ABY9UXC0_9ACTN|nr:hypothetical protein [Streptomyces sp. SCA4-21]WNE96510.1 hypothetical protein PS467_14790 [Streptomyces sp. SCA4-21]
MGVFSRVERGRAALAVVAVGAAAVAVTGCEPAEGGLSSVTIAITTDKVASHALERGGVGVRWMSCNAEFRKGRTVGASPARESERTRASDSPRETERAQETDARVDCRGRTDSDKDIRVSGRVTYVRENHCVRGDLTGEVDGRKVFQANVIGECQGRALDTASPRPTFSHPREHRTTESATGPAAPERTAAPSVTERGAAPSVTERTAAPDPTESGAAPGGTGSGTAPDRTVIGAAQGG